MTPPVNVVLVCPSYQPQDRVCGVGDYTRCLAEELARQGDQITVLTSRLYRGNGSGAVVVKPVLDDAGEATVRRVFAAADVINLQYTPELYRGRLRSALVPMLGRFSRPHPPTLVTFHTLLDGSLRSRLAVLWLLVAAHRSISTNEEITGMIRRRLPFLAGRVTEVPIGSNIPVAVSVAQDPTAARAAFTLPAGAQILVHFGLVYRGKGLETLFEALAQLRSRHPRAHLVIVGDTRDEDAAYRHRLGALVDELGLGDAVHWAGWRSPEEVSQILHAADIYVVPYDDGVSIRRGSLMAGLSHGCCVVSTVSRVSSAYLRDGDNVSLVPPRNTGALANRLDSLLRDPGCVARIGGAAKGLAERFTWDAIARQTRDAYRSVIRP